MIPGAFGKKPLCNGKPETAPHIGSFCFPLCWRCTALIISAVFATIIIYIFELFPTANLRIIVVSIALVLPCLCDGMFSYFSDYKSNNYKRVITGLFAGPGLRILAYILIKN